MEFIKKNSLYITISGSVLVLIATVLPYLKVVSSSLNMTQVYGFYDRKLAFIILASNLAIVIMIGLVILKFVKLKQIKLASLILNILAFAIFMFIWATTVDFLGFSYNKLDLFKMVWGPSPFLILVGEIISFIGLNFINPNPINNINTNVQPIPSYPQEHQVETLEVESLTIDNTPSQPISNPEPVMQPILNNPVGNIQPQNPTVPDLLQTEPNNQTNNTSQPTTNPVDDFLKPDNY